MITIHELKIHEEHYSPIRSGKKTAEIRKADRDFNVGDYIQFTAVNAKDEVVSPVMLFVEITHVVRGGKFGIHKDYDMLSIELIRESKQRACKWKLY